MTKRSKSRLGKRTSGVENTAFPQLTVMAHSVRYAIGVTALALLQHTAQAADAPASSKASVSATAATAVEKVQRVEVTGSSIKRLDPETGLPVQVITREDIERLGVTTAEQLISQVSAAVGSIEEKAQNTDTQKDSGFSGANLRGLGVSSTLERYFTHQERRAVNQRRGVYPALYRDAFASTVNPTTGFVNSVPHGTLVSRSNEVPSYSTFDLQTGYSGFKNLSLRVGVENLMNREPNVSNQGGYFRGFDQAVDATGRYAYVNASYSLK
jgi:outer membrane receptor protein involved in Fe transport